MKQYIAIGGLSAAFIFFAYWAGGRVGLASARAECAERVAVLESARNAMVVNYNNERARNAAEQKRKINEEIFTTGAGDIRARLRAKYTIAD
ncbi:MAG: hypothetical protein LBK26_02780 [Rickettsiales bacterium]|nr:hypothetical protein [Rickettsiales bacterium]